MIYATEAVMRYRQALNYLWNMHFFAPSEFRYADFDAAARFQKCTLSLFNSLVLDRLGSDFEDATFVFGEEFKIVPFQTRPASKIPDFMVNRKPSGSRIFEPIKGHFGANDLKLSIVDFFDFQLYSWRDFRYYLAKVEHFPSDPTLVGCEALVEVGDVNVIWAPTRVLGLPAQQVHKTS